MITNEKQYKSTRALVDRFRVSLDVLKCDPPKGLPAPIVKAQQEALLSQIDELEEDLTLYDDLRSGRISVFEADSLQDLPDILIRARIARSMSQKDLADYLGLKEQQIQRYEAERYRSASLERLSEVADALHIRVQETAQIVSSKEDENPGVPSASSYPLAEMYKRGWFDEFQGTLSEARKNADALIPSFFTAAYGSAYPPAMALHRKSVRLGSQVHEAAIAAWEARVLLLARRNPPARAFTKHEVTEDWIRGLVTLSGEDGGPRKAASYLREAGVSLIVEPHLPGTHLDGAAILKKDGLAIIGMTFRHDRQDNFWFTLVHEVAHLKLHLGQDELSAVFDDTECPAQSKIEEEADYFAQEALLPTSKWRTCISRYSRTEKAVLTDARKFNISPSIIAGRIRRETGDYTILKGLVGSGSIRKQF